jgi:hypothetical protein
MKAQITIQIKLSEPEIFPHGNSDESYKTCPYCGQSRIQFKKGVCICGAQVGKIQYVCNPRNTVKQYYTYIGDEKTEKLGIEELMDN